MNANPKNYPAKSPYCDHELDAANAVDGWVTCECGHRSDARWVSELGWLQTRASWVSERIRSSEPWFDSSKQTVATPVSEKVSHKNASGQQLLYILGGISLVVAVAVFTAVAWERIGAYGQLAALLLVVAIAATIAIKSRDGLVGLSNTSAAISVIVAGTGLLSAPEFGLIDKTYGYSSSFYATFVLLLLTSASFAGGFFYRVQSWSLIAIFGLVPTSLVFSEGFAQSNFSLDTYHVVAQIAVTVAAVGSATTYAVLKNRHEVSNFFKIIVTVVECFLIFNLFTHAMDTIGSARSPLFLAACYLGLTAVWAALAQELKSSEEGFIANVLKLCAAYVASVFTGFAIAFVLLPASKVVSDEYFWQPISGSPNNLIIVSAFVGAAIMLAPILPIVRDRKLSKYFTLSAVSFWFAINNGIGQLGYENAPDLKVVSLMMAAISVSLAIRWWFVISPAFFIPSVITGSISVAIFAGDTFMKDASGPEPITFAIALYLVAILQILRVHSKQPHNSFIMIGIPLSVALIPSSLVSIRLLADSNPSSTDWIRLWAVVAVSVGAVALGLKLQKSGLLIPGAIGFVFAAVPQVFIRLSVFVPRWIIFGVVGILLITVAARFEHLQKFGRDTRSWIRKLD